MSKKYLFLDIDGVLNGRHTFRSDEYTIEGRSWSSMLDQDLIRTLNAVFKVFPYLNVVVSSTWRRFVGMEELSELLARKGFLGKVVGYTPVLDVHRGHEIQQWMTENGVEPEDIVIVDDNTDMAHLLGRLVKTSTSAGVQPADCRAIIRMLGGLSITDGQEKEMDK